MNVCRTWRVPGQVALDKNEGVVKA